MLLVEQNLVDGNVCCQINLDDHGLRGVHVSLLSSEMSFDFVPMIHNQ